MADRLTRVWSRTPSMAGACVALAAIFLLCWFGPRLGPDAILSWSPADAIGLLVVGAPLCLYWLASARACTLDLSRPAGAASFTTRALRGDTQDHCALDAIAGVCVHATSSSLNGFMFETLYFILADGRRMAASPRSWRKGGWDSLAAECAAFLGGVPVSRDDSGR